MRRVLAVALALCLASVQVARAEAPVQPVRPLGQRVGLGVGGFVTAFLAHESGHLVTNLMLGNVPEFEGFFVLGFIPFFAIAPQIDCVGDTCTKRSGDDFAAGPRGKYAIVSAGYNVQHVSDELILTRHPGLRYEDAPFQKGMLLFNVFLSCMYAFSALTGLQDPHGDLAGMTRSSGYSNVALSLLLLTPAGLDTVRYFAPKSARWSSWASRGVKLGFVGVTLTF